MKFKVGLTKILNSEGGGFLTQMDKEKLISLESNRTKILKEREEFWSI